MSYGHKNKEKTKKVNILTYKFKGCPTFKQANQLNQTIGACRFIWNRMLADEQTYYENTGKFQLNKTSYYKRLDDLYWLRTADSSALATVLVRLQDTFSKFFKGECGHPNFKKKNRCANSYTTYVINNNSYLENNMLKMPKIKEPIKLNLHRQVKPGGTLKNVTVIHEPNDKWYFSLTFEYAKEEVNKKEPSICNHIGLDMSLPKLYIDSNGNIANFNKPYRRLEKRIAKEQQKLSKMVKDSNNYKKQVLHIAKLYAKVKHQRSDMLHKLSCKLTNDYDVISIEDLDMSSMKKALSFGKSISDNGWGMFVNMLSYKSERKGKYLIKVDKWFPSSKKCIHCGYIHKELKLSDRVYCCPHCGNAMDRDVQAAKNIDVEGYNIFLNSFVFA